MHGDTLSPIKDFHHRGRQANIHLFAHQAIRHRVVVSLHNRVIVDPHADVRYPFAVLEALARQWQIAEDTARQHGKTMDRGKWRVVVNMHVGEDDEEALAQVRKGERTETIDYFDETLGRPAGRSDDPLRDEFPGCVLVVRVTAERIFPNCPRYLHTMRIVEHSVHAPRPGHTPPVPAWKTFDVFRDYLPARDRQAEE